jgi:hypothetical protein
VPKPAGDGAEPDGNVMNAVERVEVPDGSVSETSGDRGDPGSDRAKAAEYVVQSDQDLLGRVDDNYQPDEFVARPDDLMSDPANVEGDAAPIILGSLDRNSLQLRPSLHC